MERGHCLFIWRVQHEADRRYRLRRLDRWLLADPSADSDRLGECSFFSIWPAVASNFVTSFQIGLNLIDLFGGSYARN